MTGLAFVLHAPAEPQRPLAAFVFITGVSGIGKEDLIFMSQQFWQEGDVGFVGGCDFNAVHRTRRRKRLFAGARNRNRTGTTVRSRDFKSLVSTYFTIRAEGRDYTFTAIKRKKGKRKKRFPFFYWSGRRVSNSRPIPWQGIALPTELLPRETGGASRSRTDLHGFAIRCITALLSRRAYLTIGTA